MPRVVFRTHAVDRMIIRRVSVEDVVGVLASGEVIEDYLRISRSGAGSSLGPSGFVRYTLSQPTIRRLTKKLSLLCTSQTRRSGARGLGSDSLELPDLPKRRTQAR